MQVELYVGKDFAIQSDIMQSHGVVMDHMREANVLDIDTTCLQTIF